MSLKVTPRARTRPDRGGDPLDGLVNLFDLGIVLSVGFLLAALSSLNLSGVLTRGARAQSKSTPRGQVVSPTGTPVSGSAARVGSVYRLPDGRLVYVKGR